MYKRQVPRDIELADYHARNLRDAEERERMERMKHAGDRPPLREDARYGPLASNPSGDAMFRADRAVWYQNVTGDSLLGLSPTQQWQACDAVARRTRAYSDGRAG